MSEAHQTDADCLFHCPNLQGVILGVGLATVEQRFVDEKREMTDEKIPKPTTGRRRKAVDVPAPVGLMMMDDDYLTGPPANGKKAKLGVGYAGDVREDVSHGRIRLSSPAD